MTLFIHIGYPKTGTTTLQSWVFPGLDEVNYLGTSYDQQRTHPQDFTRWFRIDDLKNERDYSSRVKTTAKALRSAIEHEDKPSLISVEGIIGQCLAPLVLPEHRASLHGVKLRNVFNHINRVCGLAGVKKVKLIVTIRPHDDFLTAFFAEAYRDRYGRCSHTRTFQGLIDVIKNNSDLIDSSALKYAEVEDLCCEVFGKDAIQFLNMDWMKSDCDLYARKMGACMDIDHTKILSKLNEQKIENRRRLKSGDLKMNRVNARYYADRLKGVISPKKSWGVGRHLGFLDQLKFGEKLWAPTSMEIETVKKMFAEDRATINSRHDDILR